MAGWPATAARSVAEKVAPSSVAARSISSTRWETNPRRAVIAAANDTGTPLPSSNSAASSSMRMRCSRRSASTTSPTYSGLPPACRTAARSRGPAAGTPSRSPISADTDSAGNAGRSSTTPPVETDARRSASTSARCGTGRHAATSSNGSCGTSQLNCRHTTRLSVSAQCRSSTTSTTGAWPHSRSTNATNRSVTAGNGSADAPSAAAPRAACSKSTISRRAGSGEPKTTCRQSSATRNGNR